MIYTTPEYYTNKLLYKLTTNKEKLKMIVIDEVHKMFDRNSCFRSCYNIVKEIPKYFPDIPVMAVTATLDESQLQELCSTCLRLPILVRGSIDRKNTKINISDYKYNNRVAKDDRWLKTAEQLKSIINDDYAIVYMDFKKDVDLMVNLLTKLEMYDVKAYHGGLTAQQKRKIDIDFRAKTFQVLVATESYEVGTHSPHVDIVIRVGCMRNISVLMQEFGRAGRGGEAGIRWHSSYQRVSR